MKKNLEDLTRSFVHIGACCGGHYKVSISYRGKIYTATLNNTSAYDRYRSDIPDNVSRYGYTLKQAFLAMYDGVKRANGLGEYSWRGW